MLAAFVGILYTVLLSAEQVNKIILAFNKIILVICKCENALTAVAAYNPR